MERQWMRLQQFQGSHLQRSTKQYKCEGWKDGTVGLAALPQSLNLVLNIHGEQLTTAPVDPTPSSGFCELHIHVAHLHTYTHTKAKKIFKKINM